MRITQSMRTKISRAMCFALFLCLIPASSKAGVFISVGIAPPPLPVVAVDDQPPCPEPGWIWTPGYWAYGDDGYYWVPGTWVPAPEPGLLWTPGYWGWNAGLYAWHPGYWGPHVGYYGGVNYGFGYFGLGFVGGMWRGHDFVYNTAVWRVNRTVIRNVYEDRRVIENHEVVRDRHVSYSGGPGGIRHDPDRDERDAFHDHHWGASQVQSQHESAARGDRGNYFNNNHGAPSHTFVARPMEGPRGGNPDFVQHGNQNIHQAPNGGQFNNGQQHGQNQPDQHNWQQPQQHNGNQPQQPQQQHNWNDQQQHNSQQPQQPQRQWQPQPEHQGQQPQQQHQPQPQQPQWQQQHQQPQPQPQQQQHQWQQPPQHNNPPPQQQPHNNPPPQQQPHNNPPPQQHGGGGNDRDHDHGHH